MRALSLPLLVLLLLALSACGSGSGPATRFVLRSPADTGVDFANTLREEPERFNMLDYYYIYNGGGVAVGDVNNDSLPDLYFSGNMVPGRLYLNRGGFRFEDVTERAGVVVDGWATGVTFADVDGDGFLDLYVCRAGPYPPEERTNLLFVNNGDLTFTERAADFGLADTSASTQAAFFDYDKDGDLDVYLLNHSNFDDTPNQIRPIPADGTGPGTDRLYRNEGDGTFTDVSAAAGIVYPGMSLGVGVSDLDGDGWEDVYVSNDFMAHDYVYLNDRDGTFREAGARLLKHHSYASMGHNIEDVDNDGRVDVVVLDMRPPDNEQQKRMAFPMTYATFQQSLRAGYHPQYWRNVLQRNNGVNAAGELTFSDVGQYAGVEATDWSWSPLIADFDHDGLRDLWILNGYRRAVIDMDFIASYVELQMRQGLEASRGRIKEMTTQMYDMARVDRVFRNRGDFAFEEVGPAWGVTQPSYSNGGVYADLDNDGDLDVVVSNVDMPAALYENRTNDDRFLKVYLRGAGANTAGLGADLRLYCGDTLLQHHHAVVRGYQSSVDYAVHFGLGACAVVDSLRVVWPDGAVERRTGLAAGSVVRLDRRDARPGTFAPPPRPAGLLADAAARGLQYRHEDPPYDDFARQRLLPAQYSRMGPGLAAGDVDGDGRDDLFVGGAFRHGGTLFRQRPDGTFTGAPLTPEGPKYEGAPKYEEDMGALFFDADADGHLDLYVASGSSEYQNGSPYLQDRLYLGDGRGGFTLAAGALPDLATSSSAVLAADYDADGDLDLFVGGRLKPLFYPQPGRSYLLRNDSRESGNLTFTDVTDQAAPGLREAGMVSGGLWTDYNDDGRVDLMLVGEFMPIRVFENVGARFVDATARAGLDGTSGWWNSLAGGDFDGDGDVDYVAGNLGLNTRFRASAAEPVSIYAKSFDWNGDLDPILTHYVGGTEYPVASWEDFTAQLPGKKLLFPSYESYATAAFDDLFDARERDGALVLRAVRFESSYLENLGDGRFDVRPLPAAAQMAPLFGLVVDDLDRDGRLDLLAVGNSYAPDVVTGRHDALVGLFLRGDGRGGFTAVPHQESGFFVDGDAKGLARLFDAAGRPLYAATQNDGPLRVFTDAAGRPVETMAADPLDAYALVTFADGTTRRHEFYYGDGYLSQSVRRLPVPAGTDRVTFFRYDGTARTVRPAAVVSHTPPPQAP